MVNFWPKKNHYHKVQVATVLSGRGCNLRRKKCTVSVWKSGIVQVAKWYLLIYLLYHFIVIWLFILWNTKVQILGKLRHPHLVELIGTCPESWFLVSEYLSGGSLQEHLDNNDTNALNWKTRALIVANTASALLFLHSSRPKKIIHGNLKPGNLLLDSENRCKISDYADHVLTTGLTLRCPSFRGCGPSGISLYTDPESYRSGTITHKSDIYSFGVIILQLVTGKSDGGMVGEVRRAFSGGKVPSILDSSAGEWSIYVARRLVELGLQFCQSNSRDRPELSGSLVKELECMPFLEEQTVPSFFLCPILRVSIILLCAICTVQ